MELINATRMTSGYTLGMEPSGRELLVVAIKGTFAIPSQDGALLRLHEEQEPLLTADTFEGEPGMSAPRYEADFAPRKPKCDVLLHATAHAPDGKPVERLEVGASIGAWRKTFAVVGDREWNARGGIRATRAQPFTTMPLTYDRAFGGMDQRHEDPAEHAAYMRNTSGRGFHKHLHEAWVDGSPLPNTEEIGRPIVRPDGDYAAMAFGPIARHWEPRYRYAGTYDERWLRDVAPFLPADFDDRYHQSAPPDQQLTSPVGEQEITLLNLTPGGRCTFRLPHLQAPIHVFTKGGGREDLIANLDTIVIEPDLGRVLLSWRVARPLRRDLFEIAQVLVGRKGREWWQQREQVVFPIPVVMIPMRPRETAEPAGKNS